MIMDFRRMLRLIRQESVNVQHIRKHKKYGGQMSRMKEKDAGGYAIELMLMMSIIIL